MSRLVTARIASMSSATASPLAPACAPSDRVVIYEPLAPSVSRAGFRRPSAPGAPVGAFQGVDQLEGDALHLGRALVGEVQHGVDVRVEGSLVEVAQEQHDQ